MMYVGTLATSTDQYLYYVQGYNMYTWYKVDKFNVVRNNFCEPNSEKFSRLCFLLSAQCSFEFKCSEVFAFITFPSFTMCLHLHLNSYRILGFEFKCVSLHLTLRLIITSLLFLRVRNHGNPYLNFPD